MNTEMQSARILTRKVRKSGSQGLALLLMLSGIFLMLFAWWPIGLLCIIGAFFADAKYGHAHYCPWCGNDVTPTSRLCPTCKNPLEESDSSPIDSIRGTLITVLLLIIAVVAFLLITSSPDTKTERQTVEQSQETQQGQAPLLPPVAPPPSGSLPPPAMLAR